MNIKQGITIKGEITARVYDGKTGKLKRVYPTIRNLVATEGREVFARRLSGDTTYSGEITYGALGTSTTPPDTTDTQLGTETYRNQTASATYSSNIAYVTHYYSQSECNGTYKEFGNFIDGAAGANTGQLFTHVAVDWTKSTTEILVVDAKYTIGQ